MSETTYKTRGELLQTATALEMAHDRIAQLEREIKNKAETIEQLQAKAAALNKLIKAVNGETLFLACDVGHKRYMLRVGEGYSIFEQPNNYSEVIESFTAALDSLLGEEAQS